MCTNLLNVLSMCLVIYGALPVYLVLCLDLNILLHSLITSLGKRGFIFLKNKSDALEKFCEGKSLVENTKGKKIKVLRTENGLEYINNEFNDVCAENGILRHKTCAHTPQQNGIAERYNRIILKLDVSWLSLV